MNSKKFNIRVYGIITHPEKGMLISEERYQGHHFTKFPGGGLEWGEGPIDAIKRELREEMEMEVASAEHFYTTDFFVQSAFKETDQVISIYYKIHPLNDDDLERLDGLENSDEPGRSQTFHWVKLEELSMESVRFTTDKRVVDLIMRKGL